MHTGARARRQKYQAIYIYLYSPLWGCAGDRVEMVVKVHCEIVLGEEFAAMLKMHPQNSPIMHFETISTRSPTHAQSGEYENLFENEYNVYIYKKKKRGLSIFVGLKKDVSRFVAHFFCCCLFLLLLDVSFEQ